MKKIILALIILSVFTGSIFADKKIDDVVTAVNFVNKLGVGFQYPLTVENADKTALDNIKEKGFSTIRIQTNPGLYLTDEGFTIDSAYMKKLAELIDYAIEKDFYVILCGPLCEKIEDEDILYEGYFVSEDDKDYSEEFLTAVWKQYSEAFNDSYDEHLIFETLNEPADLYHIDAGFEKDDCADCKSDFAILNAYNQLILDTIRSSGGNNTSRFVMVEGLSGRWQNITNKKFKLPKDKVKDRLIPAFHYYPMGKGEFARKYYISFMKDDITNCFNTLKKTYFSKKIPVFITQGICENPAPVLERINCTKDFMSEIKTNNYPCGLVVDTTLAFNEDENEAVYIDSLLAAAQGKEYSLSEDFKKKNEVKIESVIGKNILDKEYEMKSWENECIINPDVLVRSTPKSYELEFELEFVGHRPILRFGYFDQNMKQFDGTGLKNITAEGGQVSRDIVIVKSETVTLAISEGIAKRLIASRYMHIEGQDILVKSVKVKSK